MKIYFVGIAGNAISGLALVYKQLGHDVSGSDENYSGIQMEQLKNLGVKIYSPYDIHNVPTDTELVIQMAGIVPGTNGYKEIERAQELGIKIERRGYLLNQIAQNYISCGVAGTHGKTTTSGLLAHCLISLGEDPTYLVGTQLTNTGLSSNAGTGKFFVWEADEYKNQFHEVNLNHCIYNNIEYDHPDFFANMDEYVNSFEFFAKNNVKDSLIVNFDNTYTKAIGENLKNIKKVISFGKSKEADYSFDNIESNSESNKFCIEHNSKKYTVEMFMYGEHNEYNATGVFALLHSLGFDEEKIIEGIRTYKGVHRRFEKLYENKHVLIVSDYAHHPTAIKTTINGAKALGLPIVAVFEPHQYARLTTLWKEFCNAFTEADEAVILPIYAAREKDVPLDFSKTFVENIECNKKEYLDSYEKLIEKIKSENSERKLYLCMTASVNKESLDETLRKSFQ